MTRDLSLHHLIAGNSSNLSFFGNANNNGRFDFYTGGAYRFRIQPSGNINVGTGITLSPDGDIFAVGFSTLGKGSSGGVELYHQDSIRLKSQTWGHQIHGILQNFGDIETLLQQSFAHNPIVGGLNHSVDHQDCRCY